MNFALPVLEMLDGQRGTMAVSRDVVERLAKSYDQPWLDSVVKLSHNGEEKYMAALEICHHVHCLVRMLLVAD